MKSTLLRISAIVLALLVVIVFVFLILLQRNAGKIVDEYLQDFLEESELGQVYDIQYDEIVVRPISGKFNLKGLKIKPNDSFFASSDTLRQKYPLLFDIEADKILIAGLIKNLSFRPEEVFLTSIEIQSPDIKIIDHLSESEKAMIRSMSSKRKKGALSNQSLLPHLSLQLLSVSNGRFEIIDRNSQKSMIRVGKIDVLGNNLTIHPDNFETHSLSDSFSDLTITLSEINYPTKDGFYILSMKNFEMDLANAAIGVSDFRLIPQHPKQEFGIKFGKQTDRMDLSVKSIAINQFDFDKWLSGNEIWIDEINIQGVYMDIFRDKNVLRDLTVFPKLPHQELAALDVGVNVGRIAIDEAAILYQELMPGAAEAGMVVLSNMEVSLMNISNIYSGKKTNDGMQWVINGTLYDEGKFEVTVDFAADQPSGDFNFSGKMGEMNMSALNQILVPNEHIRIDNGRIISNHFQVNATPDVANGEMTLIYEDLKITILKEMKDHEIKERALLSLIGNAALRIFNRDRLDASVDTAFIYFERDQNKSIFNYMIKSLVNGLKASVVPGQNLTPEERRKQHKKKALPD
jgi:hypothetical protein